MNFLQIAQRIASDSATANETPFTAIAGATGRNAKIVRWANDAWRSIQNAHAMWRWMQYEFTVPTVNGQEKYVYSACTDRDTASAIDRFGSWICTGDAGTEDRWKIYDTTIGLTDAGRLKYLDWKTFNAVLRDKGAANARPVFFSIDNQDRIALAPIPDSANYTVIGPYRRSAQTLSADSDTPEMPADYHDIIVRVGLHLLGTHDESGMQIPLWELQKIKEFSRLEQDQLPQFGFAGPLA